MRVYFDFADWWIGYYRGPNHHYVIVVPTLVFRFRRGHKRCRATLPSQGRFGDRQTCGHDVEYVFTSHGGFAGQAGWERA